MPNSQLNHASEDLNISTGKIKSKLFCLLFWVSLLNCNHQLREAHMKQVKLNENIDKLLTQLSEQRKNKGALNSTKQAIVHELIMSLHKKEIK